MKLPLLIYQDMMENLGVKTACNQDLTAYEGYQIQRYVSGIKYPKHVFLAGYADDFGEHPSLKGYGILCIGKPCEALARDNGVLILYTEESLDHIYETLLTGMLSYQTLEQQIHEILAGKTSIRSLFEIVHPFFQNPMLLHDQNFYKLASIGMDMKEEIFELAADKSRFQISKEVLEDFQLDPEYQQTLHTDKPGVFSREMFGIRIMYQNLWIHGRYRGRICINESHRFFREIDIWLLGWFSRIVTEAFQHELVEENEKMLPLKEMLKKMLEGEYPPRLQMDQLLLHYGWTSGDEYFCVCFFPNEFQKTQHSIQANYEWLLRDYPESCIFIHEDILVLVQNGTLAETGVDAFRTGNGKRVRERLMKVGISTQKSDLMNFPYLYKQACTAYEVGRKVDETFWTYYFENYKRQFVLFHSLETMPAEFLCSNTILKLLEYDKEHPSELCKTLRVYLENERNIARSSELLRIHRTSLLYRIKRIVEITKCNLDDPDARYELLQSFQLMKSVNIS